MRFLTSNLYFVGFMLLGISMLSWFILNDRPNAEKKRTLSIFTDVILHFIGLAFLINFILHIREVLNFPYRIVLFSSDVIALATLGITIHSTMKYGQKLFAHPEKAWGVGQLISLLGFVNHVYLYTLYRNVRPLLFVAFFVALLSITTLKPIRDRINGLLVVVIALIVHLILMGEQPIVYVNFTFYRLPVAVMTITFVMLLIDQRRRYLSTQN